MVFKTSSFSFGTISAPLTFSSETIIVFLIFSPYNEILIISNFLFVSMSIDTISSEMSEFVGVNFGLFIIPRESEIPDIFIVE